MLEEVAQPLLFSVLPRPRALLVQVLGRQMYLIHFGLLSTFAARLTSLSVQILMFIFVWAVIPRDQLVSQVQQFRTRASAHSHGPSRDSHIISSTVGKTGSGGSAPVGCSRGGKQLPHCSSDCMNRAMGGRGGGN